jgi:cephalosporin hydroxylase
MFHAELIAALSKLGCSAVVEDTSIFDCSDEVPEQVRGSPAASIPTFVSKYHLNLPKDRRSSASNVDHHRQIRNVGGLPGIVEGRPETSAIF